MRIVINGRFAARIDVTGVQRVGREIVLALDKMIAEDSSFAQGVALELAVPRGVRPEFPLEAIKVQEVGRLSGYAWEQIELPFFAGGDLIVNLCNLAPIVSSNNITCIHDAHVWLVPENYSYAFRAAYRVLLPLAIRRSRHWTTVSQFSADQLLQLGVANRPARLVTHLGVDHVNRWSPARARLKASDLPPRYVFALGNRSRNKNIGLIRELSSHLESRGLSVVIAGGGDSRVFAATSSNMSSKIIEIGRISDDDIAVLMANATCFLFPSLFEGFGLPPVEAMRLSCPVVSSNTSAMQEVLGDAALFCDPNDIEQWIAAVDRICTDDELRQTLIKKGSERADTLTWRRCAESLLQLMHHGNQRGLPQ